MFQTKIVEKIKIRILCSINSVVYEDNVTSTVEPDISKIYIQKKLWSTEAERSRPA
jgi:hypothetical protein